MSPADPDLRLTVLGSAGSHTGPARACSGYLVEHGGTRVLLDAGNGSTANLQRFVTFQDLDAIVVSHRHVDHCVDLVGAYYALRFGPPTPRIPLFGAREVGEALAGFMQRDSAHELADVYELHTVAGGDERRIGGLHVRFADAVHLTPAVSVRIEVEGRSLVYSGDSAGGAGLIEIARDADLFLCEASWTGDAAEHPPGIHLTAREAGRIASAAGVGHLVLTHVVGGVDRDLVLEEASEVFEGRVSLAEDLDTYVIGA